MDGRARAGTTALLLLFAGLGCASISGPPSPPDPAISRCPPPLAVRLRFLEERIADEALYAQRYWTFWTGVHGGGLAVSAGMAAIEDGRGQRANHVVNAAKAGIGLTRDLLSPPLAKDALREMRGVDLAAPGGCEQRLAYAEGLLVRAAEQAHRERRSWLPHLSNLALNLIGALIVAEGYHEGSGWSSGALGLVVGEIEIWTYPARAEKILEEYRRRYRHVD
jgi:hypothetical protein